jgi:glucokinase
MSGAVGVDVGGTKIAAGVVDDGGRIIDRTRVPSPSGDPDLLIAAVAAAVDELRTRHEISAVGVGAAGFVAADRDHVHFSPHLEWGTGPVATQLAQRLQLPVAVENDANAAAWAEHAYGAGRGFADQLMVTVGTGIGGGIVLDGELYRGGAGMAAEIGHLTLVPGGHQCECGRRGCWEEYASGSALERDAQEAAARGEAPGLLAAAGSPEAVTGQLVTDLARSGVPDALALLQGLAVSLASGISSLVAVLDPSVVVVGGGVSAAGDLLLDALVQALRGDISGGSRRPVPQVRLAELGDDAGTVGCADLARRDAVGRTA